MKLPLLLLLLATSMFLSSCAGDPEERHFFNRGWIFPSEVDRP